MLSWDRPKALVHSSISRVCHSLAVSNGWGHWKRKHQCSVCIRARFGAQRLVAFSLFEIDLKGMLISINKFYSLGFCQSWRCELVIFHLFLLLQGTWFKKIYVKQPKCNLNLFLSFHHLSKQLLQKCIRARFGVQRLVACSLFEFDLKFC